MRLHELTKLLESDYEIRMDYLPDIYELFRKLDLNVIAQYSWDFVEKEINSVDKLTYFSLDGHEVRIPLDLEKPLLYNLKVLKITNNNGLFIYIGYEKFHS